MNLKQFTDKLLLLKEKKELNKTDIEIILSFKTTQELYETIHFFIGNNKKEEYSIKIDKFLFLKKNIFNLYNKIKYL